MELRAHHLLCLQGFRGVGYSGHFTHHMAKIHNELNGDPSTGVRLVAEPDQICRACPHLDQSGICSFRDGEDGVSSRDQRILDQLGRSAGEELPWSDWVAAVQHVGLSSFEPVCRECFWYPLGLCLKDGLADSRSAGKGARAD